MRPANVKKKTVVPITFDDSSKLSGIPPFAFRKNYLAAYQSKNFLEFVKSSEEANHSLAPILRR